jgi:hypothetical protein
MIDYATEDRTLAIFIADSTRTMPRVFRRFLDISGLGENDNFDQIKEKLLLTYQTLALKLLETDNS